mgnify:CR=1 FL=1
MHFIRTANKALRRLLLSMFIIFSGASWLLPTPVLAGIAPGTMIKKAEISHKKPLSKSTEKKNLPLEKSALAKPIIKTSEKSTLPHTLPKRSRHTVSTETSLDKKTAAQSVKQTRQTSIDKIDRKRDTQTQQSEKATFQAKKQTASKHLNQAATTPLTNQLSNNIESLKKPIVEKPIIKEMTVQKGDIRTKPRAPRQYSDATKNAVKHNQPHSKIDIHAKQDYNQRYGNTNIPKIYANGDPGPQEIKPSATITSIEARSATIETTIFAAAKKVGIPDAITKKFTNLFSMDVEMDISEFQGSRFNVIYEVYRKDGKFLKTGNLLAAEFINDGVHYQTIWYEKYTGQGEYYDVEGRSLKTAATQLSCPLRTPLDNFRQTSGFGYRVHPVTGGLKQHKGLDMAAPSGTPIHAAADGTIREAGWHGGYGNFVLIQHTSAHTTAYGHMSRIHPSISSGMRVRQGDIIGYVGSTGMSTGPHLHYEVRVNGIQQDPSKIANISGLASRQNIMLTGNDKVRFREHLYRMQSYFAQLNANPSKRIIS